MTHKELFDAVLSRKTAAGREAAAARLLKQYTETDKEIVAHALYEKLALLDDRVGLIEG